MTIERQNTNCLEGIACPKCNATQRFKIIGQTEGTLEDDGVVETSDFEFDQSARIICCRCQHAGTVGVFRAQPIYEERMAVISTAHLPELEARYINKYIDMGMLIGMHREAGWLIFVDKEIDNDIDELPNLTSIMQVLKEQGFIWVMFDRDAATTDIFTIYNW